MKPHKLNRSRELTEDPKKQRYDFCRWVIINDGIDPNKIIFTDEKWFCLSGPSIRQNLRIWSTSNPFAYEESYRQARDKVMCWTGIVNDKFLPIFWFQKEDGSIATVNRESYLTLLRDVLWPSVSSVSETEGYFYMQDRDPPHCTNVALEFLEEKFPNRVMSRCSNRSWPARSPDLNPMDFFVWGYL